MADSGQIRIDGRPLPRTGRIGRIRALFWSPPARGQYQVSRETSPSNRKRLARNVAARSKLRTAIKNVVSAVDAGNKDEAAAKLKQAGPIIDAAVNEGVIRPATRRPGTRAT